MNCFTTCPYGEVSHDLKTDEMSIFCNKDYSVRNENAKCPYFETTYNDPSNSVKSDEPDMVNHPPHYTQGGIECIEAIKAACGDKYEGYLQGAIIKYVWRYPHKNNPKEDLEKAKWYLERLIEEYKDGD